jgi:hypothetical protein
MSDILEYIEDYFTGALIGEERELFEQRCLNDKDFANEVAFYISARQALREDLLAQKQKEWTNNIAGNIKPAATTPLKKFTSNKWIAYAAAACILLAIGVYLFAKPANAKQLAANYVQSNMLILSQTLNGSRDSMQLAIEAYNNKEYNKALLIFSKLYKDHPENTYAKKFEGFVYLATENYDKAYITFDELSHITGLHSNGGDFYKAMALMLRSEDGDLTTAKAILQKVIDENEEGRMKAEEWLAKLK